MIDITSLIEIRKPKKPEDFMTKLIIDGESFDLEMCQDLARFHGSDAIIKIVYSNFRNKNVYDFMSETYPNLDFINDLINDLKSGEIQKKWTKYCITHICKEK